MGNIAINTQPLNTTNPSQDAQSKAAGPKTGEGGLDGRQIEVRNDQTKESLILSRDQDARELEEPSFSGDSSSDSKYYSLESSDESSLDEYLSDDEFLSSGKLQNIATSVRADDVFAALSKDEQDAVLSTNPFDVLVAAKNRAEKQNIPFDVMGAARRVGDMGHNPFDEVVAGANLITFPGEVPLDDANGAAKFDAVRGHSKSINVSDDQREKVGSSYNPFSSAGVEASESEPSSARPLGQAVVADGVVRNATMSFSQRVQAAFREFFEAAIDVMSKALDSTEKVLRPIAQFLAFVEDVNYVFAGGNKPLHHHYVIHNAIFP
ncbi:hypothetical protein [Ottowia thiooxydans]|uniref:hypothetical protein n=1 Tax=Ottowia thiooxydans TaxID=219182 RepID=UPI00041409AC|nr:hypothetical protein [Ottowia thiooxydans]